MRRTIHSDLDEQPDDEVLQQAITEGLHNDPVFWTGRGSRRTTIVVEVEDGYVTLKGVVRSASEKRRADIIARALGATSVDNRLQLDADVAGRRT